MTSRKKTATFDDQYKIVLIGDSGVGKSNLLSKYTRDVFTPDEKSTIGVEFATKLVTMADGKKIKAQVWDTAGQERYRAITNAYYRGAQGAILVYDLCKASSYENIARWLREMNDHVNQDITLCFAANKVDLAQEDVHMREVTPEMATALSEHYDLPLLETSAKSGENVEIVFDRLIKRIYEKKRSKDDRSSSGGGNSSSSKVRLGGRGAGKSNRGACCK